MGSSPCYVWVDHEPPNNSKEQGNMRDEPIALSLNEAAGYVGVSFNSMKRAVNRGEIPSRRIGARVLVSKRALDEFINGALTTPA
jgi:excisionase family DNA binding protein